MKIFLFAEGINVIARMKHDTAGWDLPAVQDIHPITGRSCFSIEVPVETESGHGCELMILADNKVPYNVRGRLLTLMGEIPEWVYLVDDFRLQDEVECPKLPVPIPPIPPSLSKTPQELINKIHKSGQYDLSTKEGCGQFTERCVNELHTTFSPSYGHIKKLPAQNQYNGHAVDALNLLNGHANLDGTTTQEGVYDIIFNSESHDPDNPSKPVFNRVGPANHSLWYYPA